MSTADEIITTLLKHGPLRVSELVEIIDIDIDGERTYYDDLEGTKSTVNRTVWALLERGALVLRPDWTLAVVKKDARRLRG